MTGAIEFAKFEACALPQDVASAFTETAGSLIGASYLPVLYIGKQIVNGINHYILCEQTITNAEMTKQLVTMVINIPAGSIGGKNATIVKIVPETV